MIDIAPKVIQPTAGTTTPPTTDSDVVSGDELYVKVTGLTSANLADTTLSINLIVNGLINGVWTVVANMGGWHGGIQAKGQPAGTFAPCEFGFRNPALNQLTAYSLTYSTNQRITAGLQAFPQNLNAAVQ